MTNHPHDPAVQGGAAALAEALFDRIPNVVFFIKDLHGRYAAVNTTLVERCGRTAKNDLLGRTAREVFPEPLGRRFLQQDLAVCATGTPISGVLELHLYPSRSEGWCVTDKIPVRDRTGSVEGVAGISRDLHVPSSREEGFSEVAACVDHIQSRYREPLRVEDLAATAGLSVYQLNRRLQAIFQITASQLITKTRIDAASALLRTTTESIGSIAQACGYCAQSAFTRRLRQTVGLTPRQDRGRHSRG